MRGPSRFWGALGLLLLIGAVFAQSYEGRVAIRDAQVRGCERGKLDRRANARGWRTAERARRQTAENPNVDPRERRDASHAATTYQVISLELSRRSRIVCRAVYPRPSPLPF